MKFQSIYNYTLSLLIFVFCISPKFSIVGVILMLIVSVFGLMKKQLKFNLYILNVLVLGLYVAYAIGALFSNYTNISNEYLEYKLSFVIFPILFSVRPNFEINSSYFAKSLSIGLLGVSIIGLVNSIDLYFNHGIGISSFLSTNFSFIHHPSYLAFFALVSLVWNHNLYQKSTNSLDKKLYLTFNLLNIFYVILCASLANLILILIIFSYWIFGLIKKKMSRKMSFLLLGTFLLLIVSFFTFKTDLKSDISSTTNSLGYFFKDPIQYSKDKPGYKTGNETRLVMWTATILQIKKHPFGVGTGNVDKHLSDQLLELNQVEMAKMDESNKIVMNPHNQFLQTFLEIGIVGFLILVLIFYFGIRLALKQKNKLLLFFFGGLILEMLFESFLQRQSGIMFFAIMIGYFSLVFYPKEDKMN